ncbi:uncharacterized protein BP01DRAFT_173364 [Aspergillus saccharolyticus JOP 1030-1]|uniref:Rhodopsin domain-containing protein n=1 Tax=Aspergillus saccharolyticus JOP 1030-1 TaxID=1450539 RepID=A0A318Z211_9EURO|nr:hypothetical protein BP01DRAFT_173364 [Aspergillus saccharolyticus JOP 1030-1]PYH41325.1 hypothetical protein BP01DRAFT_173364 [Aspergillus saccharolyticus JOP 1030-1]
MFDIRSPTVDEQVSSQSHQPLAMGLCIALLILGNVAVAIRLHTQCHFYKRPLAEDYALIVALMLANLVSIATLVGTHYGLGLPLSKISSSGHLLAHTKSIYVCMWMVGVFYAPAMLAAKVAMLLYYRRKFPLDHLSLRSIWWANLGYIILWATGSMIASITSCIPVSYFWNSALPTRGRDGSCGDFRTANTPPAALDLFSDLLMLLLPVATILSLKLAQPRQNSLMTVLCIGALICAVTVARIAVLETTSGLNSDLSYAGAPFYILASVQLHLALICVSAVPIAVCLRLSWRAATSNDPAARCGGYVYPMDPAPGKTATARKQKAGRTGLTSSTEQLRQGQLSRDEPQLHQIVVKMDVEVAH